MFLLVNCLNNKDFKTLTDKEVCVIARGFNEMHQAFIRTLSSDQVIGEKPPVICNQKNFILRGNFFKILNQYAT